MAGAVLLLVCAYVCVSRSPTLGLEVAAVLLVFVGFVVGFLVVPHRTLALTIVLFALVPMLKDFVSPSAGAIKDVVDLAAVLAAVILVGFERRRMDRWVASLVGLFLALYVVNIGGGHGAQWVEGIRLTGEPMLLLVVGFLLPDPRRNLRWALAGFVVAGLINALYGLLQQALGPATLVSLGYSYNDQVRTIGAYLRSFGTVDDPFSYAALLYFSVASAYFLLRRGWLLWVIETVLLLGLLASTVRTALLVLLGFLALAAIHKRYGFPAACLGVACAVIAFITLSHASGIQVQSYDVYYNGGGYQTISRPVSDPGGVLLNGRVSAWTAAVGPHPVDWIFGRGVGEVGTAAQRASVGVLASASTAKTDSSAQATAVDSGYLATVADVGIVGLLVQLALFGRLITLAARRVRAGAFDAWMPLAFLTALLLDALTRASFTGFPTAFVGFMLVGIALAALDETPVSDARRRAIPDRAGRRLASASARPARAA
jgi:polysaccharide biosynthesis protein PslJ